MKAGVLPVVIGDPGELRALLNSRRSYPRRPVEVRLPGLTRLEAARISRRVNRLKAECGCATGARFTLIALACGAAGLAVVHGGSVALWSPESAWVLGVAMAIGGIGKAIAMHGARKQLKREIEALLEQAARRAATRMLAR